MTAKLKRNLTKVKDPGSALTHFIAMVMAIIAAMPLLLKAARDSGYLHVSALTIFILSMIGLYAASTIYHTLDISPKINQMLRKIDHMMIFILIAGTYTPVCMIVLGDKTGRDPYKRAVDHLSQVVFFPHIHCHGLGVRACHYKDPQLHAQSRVYVDAGRRHHLYRRRHYLRTEAAHLQLQA